MPKKKPATMKDLANLKNKHQPSEQTQTTAEPTIQTTPLKSQLADASKPAGTNQSQPADSTKQPTDSPSSDLGANSTDTPESSTTLGREQELIQEIEALKAKNLRLLADIQNLLRQNQIDIERAKKSLKTEIALAMVDFVTSMHLALSYLPESVDDKTRNFVKQLQLSLETSIKNLQSLHIEVLIPQVGEPFNSEYMNAVNTPADEPNHLPTIKSVVTVGLKVDGQLVKPAQVLL